MVNFRIFNRSLITQRLSVICGIRTPVCIFASIYRRKIIVFVDVCVCICSLQFRYGGKLRRELKWGRRWDQRIWKVTREGQPRPGYSLVLRLGVRVREAQRPADRKAVEMSNWIGVVSEKLTERRKWNFKKKTIEGNIKFICVVSMITN